MTRPSRCIAAGRLLLAVTLSAALAGCMSSPSSTPLAAPAPAAPAPVPAPPQPTPAATDLTHLPVRDGQVGTAPQVGRVYACTAAFTPSTDRLPRPWISADGLTYDATTKAAVHGTVQWISTVQVTTGTQTVITGNGLPAHTTGTFPIAPSDPTYAYDHNPNTIAAHAINDRLPGTPAASDTPACLRPGAIGVLLTGAVFFNAFDANGRDANAHEVQDACSGHPEKNGTYHYHALSACSQDAGTGHSALLGYAKDGFGLYGYRGEDGHDVLNADLDVCHGHTHQITWNGHTVTLYHYHATHAFPYTLGCYRGTPAY